MKGFVCYYCREEFDLFEDYRNHFVIINRCRICSEQIRRLPDMKEVRFAS